MNLRSTISNKIIVIVGYLIIFIYTPSLFAQDEGTDKIDTLSLQKHSHQSNADPRYSVFGPPASDQWKIQASFMNADHENVSAFNFYKKNQRDKTIFLSLINNGLDNTSQYRVKQISGAAVLFPFNDDDRYKFGFISPIGVIGGGKVGEKTNNQFGSGAFIMGPWNTYVFGGYIKSTDE